MYASALAPDSEPSPYSHGSICPGQPNISTGRSKYKAAEELAAHPRTSDITLWDTLATSGTGHLVCIRAPY